MIIKTDPDSIRPYLTDASNIHGFAEILYIPENTSELIAAVKECNTKNLPMTVSGAGTGTTGSRVPGEGAVISTEKLNRMIRIDPEKKEAVLESGVILADFHSKLKQIGMMYPPDPTETNCTIGGNVATNASGAKTFKYGPTRDFIEGLKITLSDGDTLSLNRGDQLAEGFDLTLKTDSGRKIHIAVPDFDMPDIKNASGYFLKKNMDAIDLFIGSEGTLGIVSEIKLRILEAPQKLLGGIAFFDNYGDALSFVEYMQNVSFELNRTDYKDISSACTRLLEFYDVNCLKMMKKLNSQTPDQALAAVWFEQEYTSENEDAIMNSWLEVISNFSSLSEDTRIALSDKEHRELMDFRHSLPEEANERLVRESQRKLGTDTAVPHKNFRKFFGGLWEILENSGLDYMIYGHIGNDHLHANLFAGEGNDFEYAKNIYDDIIRFTLELNGTVSAEHGIGKIKKEYLSQMYGRDVISSMKKIKNKLDPDNLLGRGNLFG